MAPRTKPNFYGDMREQRTSLPYVCACLPALPACLPACLPALGVPVTKWPFSCFPSVRSSSGEQVLRTVADAGYQVDPTMSRDGRLVPASPRRDAAGGARSDRLGFLSPSPGNAPGSPFPDSSGQTGATSKPAGVYGAVLAG